MKRKLSLISSIAALLLALLFIFPLRAHAISGGVSVAADKGVYNVGDTITITVVITYDSPCSIQGSLAVSGGVSLNQGTTIFLDPQAAGSQTLTYSGTITGEGDQSVSVGVNLASKTEVNEDTLEVANVNVSGGTGFHVTTQAEIQAAIDAEKAAAEAARKAEESRQAAEAAAREATREQAERQASIDASIAEEQRKIQESEAIEESKRESSIAESLSEQESIREESVSIEESIAEISRSEAAESESIAESISESESEVERTRAYEVGRDYFVPWNYLGSEGQFLFAIADTGIEAPEGYTMTDLLINRQYVWAAQSAETGARTFLVYGTYDEEVEPEFYYFDLDTHILFPYENVHSDTDNRVIRLESTEGTAETVETPTEKSSVSAGKAVLFALLGALLGAALVCLILLILKLSL